jgi:hypothetical protein
VVDPHAHTFVAVPASAFASARASSWTPSCNPSTFDEALDSVRSSKCPRCQGLTALVVQRDARLLRFGHQRGERAVETNLQTAKPFA